MNLRKLCALLLCAAGLGAQTFRAGTARRDITPREAVPMWGYGDRHDALSQGVEDPLYADALAAEAVKLWRSLAPAVAEKPSLVVREERFQFKPRIGLKNPIVSMMYEKAFFPELIRNYQDEYADGVRPRLSVVLLNGEIAMVAASGESFSNHAVRLKERARMKHLFFFGYCNGYHQYFPTHRGGGGGRLRRGPGGGAGGCGRG